jgi:hypothetical protein
MRFWPASSGRPSAFADRFKEPTAAGYRAFAAMERNDGREFLRRQRPDTC